MNAKKSNTTKGRGILGGLSYGPLISQQHDKDLEARAKLHNRLKPETPIMPPAGKLSPTKSRVRTGGLATRQIVLK